MFLLMRNIAIYITFVCLSINNLLADDVNANARLKYYISMIEENREPFYKMISIYDSVIKLCNDEDRTKYILDKARLAGRNGEYASSFNTYQEALNIINSDAILDKQSIVNKKDCMYQMAKMAMNLGMYDESTAIFFELLDYNKGEDINCEVRSYSMLSFLFMSVDKIDAAEEYLDKAINTMKDVDTISPNTLFTVYGNAAGIFYNKMQYDSAIKYLSMAEANCKRIPQMEYTGNIYHNYAIVYHNYAIIYQGLEEYGIAEEYFMRILELTKDIEMSYPHALALQNLAFLCKVQKKNERALSYYQKALDISTKIGASRVKSAVLIEMSDLFYDRGDYKKSRDYMEMGILAKDSVFNVQIMDRIMVLTNRFETRNEKVEKELMIQTLLASELANKNKTIMLGILIAVFIVLLLVITVSFYKLMQQRKANKMLSDTIQELQHKTLMDIENSKNELAAKIDDKNRELTSTALCLIKANEMLSTLKEEVKKLSDPKIDTDNKEIIKEMGAVLNSYNPEQGWAEFKLYFEQVHQSFFTGLNDRHPSLTHGEQRICALLVLNMSAKEIATITNRSARTIESLVYKIRLKMNIPTDTKTICYLRKFM